MKFTYFLLFSLFLSAAALAQNQPLLQFKTRTVSAIAIDAKAIDTFNKITAGQGGKNFVVLQFSSIPTEATRKILSASGITLLDYIPDQAYTAAVSGQVNLNLLQQAGARSIYQPSPLEKMDARLAAGRLPSSAVKIMGTIDLWISFPSVFNGAEVMKELQAMNVEIISSKFIHYRILHIRAASSRITDLASKPFIDYVQAAPGEDQVLNYNSRYGSRANVLNASIANGGKGLNGEGVVVGVGDNADVQTHIDFAGRLINRSAAPITSGHGHHVTGTVGGAGNGNELYKGYASKSTIIMQAFNGIILNAATYVNDYGMVVTNNSYGDNIECDYHGTYDLYSRLLDQMAIDLPSLENVFSAGNSGASTCDPFLPGYHTVLGGYQSAKNVVVVGATTDSGLVAGFSSRGPVADGRIKPDVVAMGQRVASTWSNNIYGYNNGTSMSSPAVAGGLTLLYQRYRQLHASANPKNGLMKALLCNGANDRGNPGPDFQYGFGWMNLLRSVDMLENNRYFTASVAPAATNTHTVTVPANTAQLKVLLYWNDPAASPISGRTLVNDLDLEVVDGANVTVLPKILDTANLNLGLPAISGADHRNNMEQVVINNPAAGNFSVHVKGTAITQNPNQEYFLVFDPVPVQLKITAPAGGEALAPSTVTEDMLKISWESFGYSGTATLELSLDNGTSWTTLNNNLDINRPVFTWWVPNVSTSQALVRITKNGTGESSTSLPFTITGQPLVSPAPVQCEGYFNVNWTAVAGATDYEVMMLRGDEMKTVAFTTATSYSIGGLSKDSVYWVTVRARVNGKPGRRPQAISRQPVSGSCAGTISDNDLKIDAVLSPTSGRLFTSTQLNAATPVSVRIKNLDDAAASNFTMQYSVNGGAFVSENITVTIAAGGVYTHTFAATADLSAVGNYDFVFVVKNSQTDPVSVNDTSYLTIKHLDNQPLNLGSYFVDNLESAAPASYEKDTLGLTGIPRYDLSRTTAFGRARTFVNSGIAYSGSKAVTLDMSRLVVSGNTSYLYGTFNLVNYNKTANDLRLDFRYNNHGQVAHPNNKVWIRGNDAQPWIEVYDLDDNQNEPGLYKKTASIELSDMLAANAQDFSTSFQVRWGQWGQLAATDKENAAGYSIDDIRLYEVFNDLQMLSIDEPIRVSCGLTSTSVIKVSVRNSSNVTLTNIPLRYQVNNGSWITETLPSLAGNTTAQYSFTTTANLSALGTYTLRSVIDLSGDSFHDNDTATSTVIHSPVISAFPYLQDFESNTGSWFAEGKHNSWEYGTPASININRAASGARAWKTRLKGHYNDLELSYLYSPCFDIAAMSNPTLSFSLALDIEDCGAQLCDASWVEYSADGISWNKLGAAGSGTNWYNKPVDQLWSIQDFTRWHVATVVLPSGLNRLRLRFVLASDPAANREGVAIDDIHIYNNTNGIYDGVTMAAPVSQNVAGAGWVDFTSSGKLVASIRPDNQNLGATAVQAYINGPLVRFTNAQYYLDRNITIKPANATQADSISVRFYFLDREVDSLIKAIGCSSCSRPESAYELGVSKYTDPDKNFENGTISDNNQGVWTYISSDMVRKVPFDKGYYAEFRVKDFSEFWLNNGGFDRSSSLPVKLMDFTVQKLVNNDVLLAWKVGSETNLLRYEIEVARSNADLQVNNFVKIGEVAGAGNTTSSRNYNFTDTEADKIGNRYYRLKLINLDGSYSYSLIRQVVFDDPVLWHVYPNPSKSLFNLVFQLNNGEVLYARILDAKGSLIQEYRKTASGSVQKLNVDLGTRAAGVYLLEVNISGKKQTFKLFKQ